MTDEASEYIPATMTRGVISYALDDGSGMIAHGICIIDPDTGVAIKGLAGITLTPEIARKVAANLTWQSIQAEENKK